MKIYKILTICGLTAAMACSCSEEKTYDAPWSAGEAVETEGVFFPGTEEILSVSAALDPVVELKMARMLPGDEIEVPVIAVCEDANVKVPSTVKFAKDCTETTLQIRLDGLEVKKLTPLTVTVDDAYLNPYAGGRAVFEGSVIISEWEEINPGKGVKFSYLDWSYNPYTTVDPIYSKMYNMGGTDRYRVENFMNSGMDFTFELKESPYEAWKGYYRIMPMSNQAMTADYGYNSNYNDWWLADEAQEWWPEYELTSNGSELIYYGVTYYWFDDSSQNEYCFVRKQGTADSAGTVAEHNTAYMGCFAYTNEDWTRWSPYLRLTFEWKL